MTVTARIDSAGPALEESAPQNEIPRAYMKPSFRWRSPAILRRVWRPCRRVAAQDPQPTERGHMPQIGDPKQLFAHKLGATLTMEETVVGMLKELEGKANETELKEQLSHHRDETQGQIANLTQAFGALGKEPERQPCPVIDGLKTEGEQLLEQTSPQLHDGVILSGCAEVEHHEIAVYDGLITLADELGEDRKSVV